MKSSFSSGIILSFSTPTVAYRVACLSQRVEEGR